MEIFFTKLWPSVCVAVDFFFSLAKLYPACIEVGFHHKRQTDLLVSKSYPSHTRTKDASSAINNSCTCAKKKKKLNSRYTSGILGISKWCTFIRSVNNNKKRGTSLCTERQRTKAPGIVSEVVLVRWSCRVRNVIFQSIDYQRQKMHRWLSSGATLCLADTSFFLLLLILLMFVQQSMHSCFVA